MKFKYIISFIATLLLITFVNASSSSSLPSTSTSSSSSMSSFEFNHIFCTLYISGASTNTSVGCGATFDSACQTLEEAIATCSSRGHTRNMEFYFDSGLYVVNTYSFFAQLIFVYGSTNNTDEPTIFDFQGTTTPFITITEPSQDVEVGVETQFFLFDSIVRNLNSSLAVTSTYQSNLHIELQRVKFEGVNLGTASLFDMSIADPPATNPLNTPNSPTLLVFNTSFTDTVGEGENLFFTGYFIQNFWNNCTFIGNKGWGNYINSVNGSTEVENSIFSNNIIYSNNGAPLTDLGIINLVNQSYYQQEFSNLTFTQNIYQPTSSEPSIALFYLFNSTIILDHVIFTENTINTFYTSDDSTLDISSTTFTQSQNGFSILYSQNGASTSMNTTTFTQNNLNKPTANTVILPAITLVNKANFNLSQSTISSNTGIFIQTADSKIFLTSLTIENNIGFSLVDCQSSSNITISSDVVLNNNTIPNDHLIQCSTTSENTESSCNIITTSPKQFVCNNYVDNSKSEESKKGLSPGVKAGIIIGVIAVLAIGTIIVIVLIRKHHHHHHYQKINSHHH